MVRATLAFAWVAATSGHFSLIVAGACFLSACDSTRSSQAEAHYDVELPAAEPQGPVYEDADLQLKVGAAEACHAAGVLGPPAGKARWAIPISVSARSQRQVPTGPMLFSLLMDSQMYRPILAGCRPPFSARQLKPGETVEAHVVFDLPSLVPPLKLVYEPFVIGRQPIKAQVLVPRSPDQP